MAVCQLLYYGKNFLAKAVRIPDAFMHPSLLSKESGKRRKSMMLPKRELWMALSFLMILLLVASPARASGSFLPWDMTWDISIRDYVDTLQNSTSGGEYTIREFSGGTYYVILKTGDDESPNQYSAAFKGQPTLGKIMDHDLADVENKSLRLKWLCIDTSPVPSVIDLQDTWDTFLEFYHGIEPHLGQETAAYSSVKLLSAKGSCTAYYAVPRQNGEIDFDAIQRHFLNEAMAEGSYWLIIGDGHTACRLYASNLSEQDGISGKRYVCSYFFTKEEQERLPQNAPLLP